jgi:uncharacterized protein YuzE
MHKQAVPLSCTYDAEADAAYICLDQFLAPGAAVKQLIATHDGASFVLDLDAEGRVLGLEVIGARNHLPVSLLDALQSG